MVNLPMDWSAAALECRSLHRDAHLLIINNTKEQLAITTLPKSTGGQFDF